MLIFLLSLMEQQKLVYPKIMKNQTKNMTEAKNDNLAFFGGTKNEACGRSLKMSINYASLDITCKANVLP